MKKSRRQFCQTLGLAPLLPMMHACTTTNTTPNTRLILLGTQGGPNFNLDRGECANLMVVGDKPYLIDCGYGTMRSVIQAGANYLDIGNIFLTHLHDDHNADIPALLSHQWTQGRVEPTIVHGPYGTDDLISAANLYNQANTEIRLVDEARSVLPSDMFSGQVISVNEEPKVIFEDDRVQVLAVENSHFPPEAKAQMPHRSLSYRFNTSDRSVVFSGDTAYSEALVRLSQDADILVCEAMQTEIFRQAFEQMVANGNYADNPEGIWKHIVETHTPTNVAGRMAAEADVSTLVLNHLIPGALDSVPDQSYIEGAREHFDGPVIVGRDLMEI